RAPHRRAATPQTPPRHPGQKTRRPHRAHGARARQLQRRDQHDQQHIPGPRPTPARRRPAHRGPSLTPSAYEPPSPSRAPRSPCLFTLRTAADWVHAAAPGRCDEVRHSQSGGDAIPGPATASRPTAVLTSPWYQLAWTTTDDWALAIRALVDLGRKPL